MDERTLLSPCFAAALACAFQDCGQPRCPVCRWARTSPTTASASTTDAIGKVAVPKAARDKPIWMPKRRHRVGPHR